MRDAYIILFVIFLQAKFLSCYRTSFSSTRFGNDDRFKMKMNVESNSGSFFYSRKAFDEIGISNNMKGVLNSLNLDSPSKIQALSFQDLYIGKHCILADQTGSGKTLAYLLPVVQRMLELRINGTLNTSAQSRKPLIVIITPTSELALQVSKVVKSIANVLKFRTSCITSSTVDIDSEQKKLRLGTEILISTPGRLLNLLDKNEVYFDDLQALILDEADVLFLDQSFPLPPIGSAAPTTSQFIFVTATLPDIVTEQITMEFPNVEYRLGPGLHRIAPTIDEVLVDCSGSSNQAKTPLNAFENKRLALLRALEQTTDIERTIIFCNSIDQCRRVENVLQRADRNEKLRKIYPYHGAIDAKQREQNLKSFSRMLIDISVILVCTDRASRGMDFDNIHVEHVILFDFPSEPSEYVRRIGRTGRAGRKGRATIMAYGRQVPIAKEVITSSIAGKRIDPVPDLSIYKRK
jgi:ATP-dependent RNA helicase DDX18/HAS1